MSQLPIQKFDSVMPDDMRENGTVLWALCYANCATTRICERPIIIRVHLAEDHTVHSVKAPHTYAHRPANADCRMKLLFFGNFHS